MQPLDHLGDDATDDAGTDFLASSMLTSRRKASRSRGGDRTGGFHHGGEFGIAERERHIASPLRRLQTVTVPWASCHDQLPAIAGQPGR